MYPTTFADGSKACAVRLAFPAAIFPMGIARSTTYERELWLNDELVSDPNNWLENAEEKSGSWWPDWDAWMKLHSSGTVPAATEQGNAQYRTTEPAPGRYVKQKSN
jgi:poly(3-hydroxyalkanoate) synthetase